MTDTTTASTLDAAQVASLDAYKAENAKHGWTGRAFSFSPGFLNLNSDGGASIGCMDTEAEWESDDETGKMAVFFNMPPEEVLALRDYLNAALPTALQQQLDEARAERDAANAMLAAVRRDAMGLDDKYCSLEARAEAAELALSQARIEIGEIQLVLETQDQQMRRALSARDAPQAQAVKALGDACQLFEGFDDAAKIMITAKSSKGGSVKLDGPALTVGALRALTRPSTTEAKPVDPKLIENVAYICGQWEKNQGASSLTIAVRLLLAALDNDKEQSE